MGLSNDIRNASANAVGQVVTRVDDLPRPVAAVIGAGDRAADLVVSLRTEVNQAIEQRGAQITVPKAATSPAAMRDAAAELPGKVQKLASDLPGKADELRAAAGALPGKVQKLAGDLSGRAQERATGVARTVEELATTAPAKASQLAAELPERTSGVAGQLKPEALRQTAGTYLSIIGAVYDDLADHGQQVWDKIRQAIAPEAATTVDATSAGNEAESPSPPTRRRNGRRSRDRRTASEPGTTRTASTVTTASPRSATRKSAPKAAKPAGTRSRKASPDMNPAAAPDPSVAPKVTPILDRRIESE